MQKTIINSQGSKVGVYYPLTGRLVIFGRNTLKLNKQAFKDYCVDMDWQVL